MISLILPYWDRQEAANKAIHLLEKQYPGMDLEVVVVDDGNKIPFVSPATSLNLKVIRLPNKPNPTPQSRAWNAGVHAATGNIICLSCVEILHEKPVLQKMAEQLKQMGKNGYVLASAWCPEINDWQCHSSFEVETLPKGTGPSFCGMLYRKTFDIVGGFDENYHDGAGYEDKDFVYRLLDAGVKFKIMDDLTVIHPKTGASIQWPSKGFERNRKLYMKKWGHKMPKPLTFVCLKAGTTYGPEYVNILFDMVRRNLTDGFPGQFWCITDDPSGLDDGIKTIPLPSDLETWWGKLYMFKRGLFPDGDRCLFMDLDTLLVGNIDDIAKYDGEFATLRDFYFPQQVGPAIIAWKAGGVASTIWDEWVNQSKPRHPQGDLWWINNLDQGRFARQIDILQDKFPSKFVSYKVSCNPYPPKGTSVVCFHGQPKPDNCGASWVAGVWKIGGNTAAELDSVANTDMETVRRNVASACERDLPWLEINPAHDKHAVIVGGGPSLKDTIEEVKWRSSIGDTVISINGSGEFLYKQGIFADIQVVIDARKHNARFMNPLWSKERYIASQCDSSVFDVSGSRTTLFHMNTTGIESMLPEDREANLISSGTTVGLAALVIAYTQGYRTIHLHGFDSSYSEDHHAYPQPENDQDVTVEVSVGERTFKCASWMAVQAQQFQTLALQLAAEGVIITVAGDGLIPHLAHCMSQCSQGE